MATRSAREHVTRHVVRAREAGYRPVVVVSAMGRKGDPYATDTLMGLVSEVGALPSGRELDLLMSCGEVISTVVLAQNLKARGYPSIALTGLQAGILTDENFGDAAVISVDPAAVRQALEEGKIPVVAGFQGGTVRGEVTTLGRGGSDTSAAILGVALGAELIEIYTDVDGMKTADPRIVPEAVTLERATYSEVIEMAHLGAKVIHPRAVEVAMAGRIPLKIRQTGSEAPGTLITSSPHGHTAVLAYRERPVTGIAHVPGQVRIELAVGQRHKDAYLQVFDALGQAEISVDMIRLSQDRITFLIEGDHAKEAESVLNELEVEHTLTAGFAKVSAVGAGMHGVPGVMARLFQALARANVTIYETTDSHANISCLVRQAELKPAIVALHDEFQLTRGEKRPLPTTAAAETGPARGDMPAGEVRSSA